MPNVQLLCAMITWEHSTLQNHKTYIYSYHHLEVFKKPGDGRESPFFMIGYLACFKMISLCIFI